MSKISKERQERIKEELLRELFDIFPHFDCTETISEKVNRDNEFILKLLKELKKKGLIGEIQESKGKNIKRKWQMRSKVYGMYKELI